METPSKFLYLDSTSSENKIILELKKKVEFLESHIRDCDQFLDFSQLGEQMVLINIIGRISSVHQLATNYLDIGGFHPICVSNTFRLYSKHGWSGVIVEPNPNKLSDWHQTRPNDKLICAALVPDGWNIETVEMSCTSQMDSRESISKAINRNSRLQVQKESSELITYLAPAIKFQALIDQCKKFDLLPTLMNIDIEGLEEEIIIGSKVASFKIPVLCIEHFLNEFTDELSIFAYSKSNLVKYLEDSGYYLVSVCGISLIFCHKDYWVPYS